MRDVAASSETTIEPHVTAFISSTPPPGSGKNCNLSFQRTPGSDQYSVWVYYDHTLYTMNSIEWHYLYCDNGVFVLQQLRTQLHASIFTVVFTTATVLLIMY